MRSIWLFGQQPHWDMRVVHFHVALTLGTRAKSGGTPYSFWLQPSTKPSSLNIYSFSHHNYCPVLYTPDPKNYSFQTKNGRKPFPSVVFQRMSGILLPCKVSWLGPPTGLLENVIYFKTALVGPQHPSSWRRSGTTKYKKPNVYTVEPSECYFRQFSWSLPIHFR